MDRPQKTQQVLDFALPRGKRERKAMMTAYRAHWLTMIERLADLEPQSLGLTRGEVRRVVGFLKWLLKDRNTSWNGRATFRQKWLAADRMVHPNTIGNWLKWSKRAGAIDYSTDTDNRGVPRTTVEFTWGELGAVVSMPPTPEFSTETTDDQITMVGDQITMVGDQITMVGDQITTAVTVSPSPSSPTLPRGEAGVAILLKEVGISEQVAEFAEREASDRGLGVDEVAELVDTYRAQPHRFESEGAVVHRITTGEWPVEGIRSAAEIAAARVQREQTRRAEIREREARQQSQVEYRRELDRLEEVYGPRLDQMSAAERAALAERAGVCWMSPRSQCARSEMLQQLHRESSE